MLLSITSLLLADEADDESARIFEILGILRKNGVSKELEIELTDIEFWANYGLYFASKWPAVLDEYGGTMPHQFDREFSWRKHIIDVENDIAIAEGYQPE